VIVAAALVVGFASSASASLIITGKQIKDHTIRGRDVHAGSIRSRDIKDGSLSAADLDTVVRGPLGPPGTDGQNGRTGPTGLSGLQYVPQGVSATPNAETSWAIDCPAGTMAVGGGASSPGYANLELVESAQVDFNPQAWWIVIANSSDNPIPVDGWAVCTLTS
jgi:hypothetical protein